MTNATTEPEAKQASTSEHEPPNLPDESNVQKTTAASAKPSRWILRSSDQIVTALLATIVLGLMIVRWVQLSGWGADPVEIDELPPVANQFRLEVNSASTIEWSQLDGIGEVLAERIVESRERAGDFENIDDLLRVEGIGPRTLEQIRPWLTITQND